MDPRKMMYDLEVPEEGASALGTGETDGTTDPSSAGTLNSDTGEGGGPPETIPYSRFKEVNDELAGLRGYKDLAEVGYDPDSLRQLAEFEVSFRSDPVSTWIAIADQIDGLPDEVKDVVKRHMQGPATGATPTVPTPGDSQDGEMPEWAKQLVDRVDKVSESESQRMEREASDASNRLLDGIMGAWRQADEKAGMKPLDDDKMLTFIATHARGAREPQEILDAARGEWLELREMTLESAVQPGSVAGAPRSVPSGAAPINADQEPKTLAEASLRAKARLQQAEARS
jgi:hypothetical protein